MKRFIVDCVSSENGLLTNFTKCDEDFIDIIGDDSKLDLYKGDEIIAIIEGDMLVEATVTGFKKFEDGIIALEFDNSEYNDLYTIKIIYVKNK